LHFHHHVYFRNHDGAVESLLVKVRFTRKKDEPLRKALVLICECREFSVFEPRIVKWRYCNKGQRKVKGELWKDQLIFRIRRLYLCQYLVRRFLCCWSSSSASAFRFFAALLFSSGLISGSSCSILRIIKYFLNKCLLLYIKVYHFSFGFNKKRHCTTLFFCIK